MNDFEKHIPYFSAIYNLYQSASSVSKPNILASLINYGNFPAFIYYLNQIWFLPAVTPKIATENLEFLIIYFQQFRKKHGDDFDVGKLTDLMQFLIRVINQKPQPKNYKEYSEFLFLIFEKLKALEDNIFYDSMIKFPLEFGLFPLSIFGVVNSNYNTKVINLLFSLQNVAFQKDESKDIWIKSFIILLSNKIKNYDNLSQQIIIQIKTLLSDSTIKTDQKLKILYSITKSIKENQLLELYKKFYATLLKNISPKTTSEGISYIFKVASEYYKILIPQNEKEKSNKKVELVLNPLFTNALPFFFNSPEIEKSAIEFANLLESNILQQYISQIIEDNLFVRASLFFISHFPTEKTSQILFKPINNQIYVNAQREAIIYFLNHFECPQHQLSIAFSLLKASDLEENGSIDKIIDKNPVLYCSSAIKYITFCIDGIEKVIHFSEIFLKKKKIPIISISKYINHSILTLSVHFFGYKKYVKNISALISYLKSCKENNKQEKDGQMFDFESSYNDESHIWPNFIHNALTTDDEWREELCNLSLQRLGKQEFPQCIILASISKDPMILHNSVLLLLKDPKIIPILFAASATNLEKETLNEIKNIILSYSKEQEESKKGFFASLFSRSNNESIYPKVDVFSIILNSIPSITQILPFSSQLFDILFTIFPADQKPQYMTLTCKAIFSVCQLIGEGERKIIHSIIDRLCNSDLSLCDISVFEPTLIKALSVNQSITEELATKISSLYISLVLKKQISENSKFEETFLNDYYGELTLNAFSKVLLSQMAKNDDNESIFICFKRVLKNASVQNVSYFQRFDHVLISNLFSNSSRIRKVCFKSLNIIEKLNFGQEEIDKMIMSNNVIESTNETFLYFKVKVSKKFVDLLSKKFTYKSSSILIEMMLNHFSNSAYNNQVSIANFIRSTFSFCADKYINEDNNNILVTFFKLFRKIDLINLKCLNDIYTDIVIYLAKVNSNKFISLILEQTTHQILNEFHIKALCDIDSFIQLFIEHVTNLVKEDKRKFVIPNVEIINRITQIFGIIINIKDSDGFKHHSDFVISFIIILCLTSVTLSKWTSSFKSQHFKNLSFIFAKFASLAIEDSSKFADNFLNNINDGGVVINCTTKYKFQFQVHFNLLKVLHMFLERANISLSSFDILNGTIFHVMKYFCVAIQMKYANSNDEYENLFNIILNEFDNKIFTDEYFQSILFYLSDSLTIDRLKELRKNKKEKLQIIFGSLIGFFQNYNKKNKLNSLTQITQVITKDESLAVSRMGAIHPYASLSPSSIIYSPIKPNSILFLRIILVLKKKIIKSQISEILKSMNIFILYDPTVLSLVEFSAALFKIIKVESDPSLFISHFNIIIVKMAASIISHNAESRKVAYYFLSHLIKTDSKSNSTSKDENENENDNNNNNNDENADFIGDFKADEIDFRSLFAKLASLYNEIDKNSKRYIEITKIILNVASIEFERQKQNKEYSCIEDLEKMAAIVLPLKSKKNGPKSSEQEVINKFINFMRAIGVSCNLETMNCIISLTSEFTSLF